MIKELNLMQNYYQQKYYNIASGDNAKPIYITHKQKCERDWLRDVSNNYELDVACDLTFRQRKEVVVNGRSEIHKLNDSFANQNVSMFLHKLNQRVYGNSYRRYKKKLDVLVSLEGGCDMLRENADKSKHLHAHISIQQPNHIDTDVFISLLNEIWIQTDWGFAQTNVSKIRTKTGRFKYHIKNSLDALIPALTNCNKFLRTQVHY